MSLPPALRLAVLMIPLLPAITVLGQGRVWLVEAGADPQAAPDSGATFLNIGPRECVTIFMWVEDPTGNSGLLNAYHLVLPWFAGGGGGGTVEYLDNDPGQPGGDSIEVDQTSPDWVFVNTLFDAPATYNETPDDYFGVFYATLAGTGVDLGPDGNSAHPAGANYIAQCDYCASVDACGTFELQFAQSPDPPPVSALFTPVGANWQTTFQPLDIFVGPLNDDCVDREVLPEAEHVIVPYGTTCATPDGDPGGCDGAANDMWYEYTPLGDCVLSVSASGAATVTVYEPQAGCTPAAGEEVSCGECAACVDAESGDVYFIRLSGQDVAGDLTIDCPVCQDSVCEDGNPCTDDLCIGPVCGNIPNQDPCEDGDPCTLGDQCADGACQPGTEIDACDDGDPCTADFCVAGLGCSNNDVNGQACTARGDCVDSAQPGVDGADCLNSTCVCPAPAPVPAVSRWGMLILCMLLALGLAVRLGTPGRTR